MGKNKKRKHYKEQLSGKMMATIKNRGHQSESVEYPSKRQRVDLGSPSTTIKKLASDGTKVVLGSSSAAAVKDTKTQKTLTKEVLASNKDMAAKGSSAEVKYPWMGIRPACSDSDEDFEIVGPRKHVKPEGSSLLKANVEEGSQSFSRKQSVPNRSDAKRSKAIKISK